MNENDLLEESLGRLLDDHDQQLGHASIAGLDEPLWKQLVDSGLDRVGFAETAGGSGGGLDEAAVVIRQLARHGAAVPVAETTLLAGWLAEHAGWELPPGPSAVIAPRTSLEARPDADHTRLTGVARRVPWLAVSTTAVVVARDAQRWVVALLEPNQLDLEPGANLAGEPRDTVALDIEVPTANTVEVPHALIEELALRRALIRSIQTAGALETVLRITVDYVNERNQFGRSLSKFQVIKQELARVAGETAAANGALAIAMRSLGHDEAWLPIAAAKVRSARAASAVAPIAHQFHGALGFTEEHVLHRYTTRLWSWRDEFGTQSYWERELGRRLAANGAAEFWPQMTQFDHTHRGDTI